MQCGVIVPKISVIMSAYNSEKYVAESIQSILDQTYPDFELIITDDASTDNTFSIISSISDKRIKVIRNENNCGLTANLNSMLSIAKGDYIARIDADDLCVNSRFDEEVRILDQDKEAYLVCSYIEKFGDEVGITKVRTDSEFIRANIMFNNFIPHSTVMFRNDGKYKYNEVYNGSEDYELWERVIGEGNKIVIIPKPLVKYRVHSNQYTHVRNPIRDEQRFFVCCRAFYRLGLELTKCEKELYKRVVINERINSISDIYQLRQIYKRIYEVNRINGVYKPKVLRDVLRQQYITLIKIYLKGRICH